MTARGGDGDELDDTPDFGSMRAMFRDMAAATDEEPAAGGLDALMAAARARVAPPAPGPMARFATWFTALARQPAFAAAATLVVVASVGGLLYVRGGRMPERSAAPASVATGAAASGSAAMPAADAPAPVAPPPPVAPAAAEVPAATVATPIEQRRADAKPAARAASGATATVTDADMARLLDETREENEPDFSPKDSAGGGEASAATADEAVTVTVDKPKESSRAPTEPPATESAKPAARAAAVRAAAERGDCATARTLAATLTPAERSAVRAASKAVAACLTNS